MISRKSSNFQHYCLAATDNIFICGFSEDETVRQTDFTSRNVNFLDFIQIEPQIADVSDSFLAVADTEIGHGNRIPLWLFGFMYQHIPSSTCPVEMRIFPL